MTYRILDDHGSFTLFAKVPMYCMVNKNSFFDQQNDIPEFLIYSYADGLNITRQYLL